MTRGRHKCSSVMVPKQTMKTALGSRDFYWTRVYIIAPYERKDERMGEIMHRDPAVGMSEQDE